MSTADHDGRCVLVTGAGGYIGSALAKAIAAAGARHIVLLDASEYNLFAIQRELELGNGHVSHEAFLGTVNDADLLDDIFSRFRPEIVYHAAAFKHVPLLELNPIAAVERSIDARCLRFFPPAVLNVPPASTLRIAPRRSSPEYDLGT